MRNGAKCRGNRSKHDRHRDFLIFKMASVRHLGFFKIKILTVIRVMRENMRYLAKFGGNRSNRCRAMAIFLFFQKGGLPTSSIFKFSNF